MWKSSTVAGQAFSFGEWVNGIAWTSGFAQIIKDSSAILHWNWPKGRTLSIRRTPLFQFVLCQCCTLGVSQGPYDLLASSKVSIVCYKIFHLCDPLPLISAGTDSLAPSLPHRFSCWSHGEIPANEKKTRSVTASQCRWCLRMVRMPAHSPSWGLEAKFLSWPNGTRMAVLAGVVRTQS